MMTEELILSCSDEAEVRDESPSTELARVADPIRGDVSIARSLRIIENALIKDYTLRGFATTDSFGNPGLVRTYLVKDTPPTFLAIGEHAYAERALARVAYEYATRQCNLLTREDFTIDASPGALDLWLHRGNSFTARAVPADWSVGLGESFVFELEDASTKRVYAGQRSTLEEAVRVALSTSRLRDV